MLFILSQRGREGDVLNPPKQLVDRSYPAYKNWRSHVSPNPTNAVGGLFILSLQKLATARLPESHQRSWWIVHTQPTKTGDRTSPRIPPTALVGFWEGEPTSCLGMNSTQRENLTRAKTAS